jgi:hypothetical protein
MDLEVDVVWQEIGFLHDASLFEVSVAGGGLSRGAVISEL